MEKQGNLWSIVLAGGEGSRLSQITGGFEGSAVPKQYCSVKGGPSLLRQALRRARAVAGPDRTAVVVAAEHRRWWSVELADLPSVNVVVQPCNRGTACGVLLPLMQVLARDPEATVVVLPSDHVVADEPTLIAAINAATEHIQLEPDRLVLLGFEPEGPDTGLGWITRRSVEAQPVSPVSRFVEKPPRSRAEELVREGALWNSFIFAMRAAELLALFEWALPWLTKMFKFALGRFRLRIIRGTGVEALRTSAECRLLARRAAGGGRRPASHRRPAVRVDGCRDTRRHPSQRRGERPRLHLGGALADREPGGARPRRSTARV